VLREERVTPKLDVYSFAICFWEMLSQQLPFIGMNLKQVQS